MNFDPGEMSERLRSSERKGVPISPLSSASLGVDEAYAVQSHSVRAWLAEGRRLVGRKIGLTNPRVQEQLGVTQPDFGVLFEDMQFASGATVPRGRVLQARIEAEMAFVVGDDLATEPMTTERVADAINEVRPALEIVGSRIVDWQISIFDTIADNASSGAFVIGDGSAALTDVDLTGATMTLTRTREGVSEVVSTGCGSDCLGSPLLAATWLAAELVRRGDRLGPGDIVLTGALGPMVPVEPGDHYDATISGLGDVSIRFD